MLVSVKLDAIGCERIIFPGCRLHCFSSFLMARKKRSWQYCYSYIMENLWKTRLVKLGLGTRAISWVLDQIDDRIVWGNALVRNIRSDDLKMVTGHNRRTENRTSSDAWLCQTFFFYIFSNVTFSFLFNFSLV